MPENSLDDFIVKDPTKNIEGLDAFIVENPINDTQDLSRFIVEEKGPVEEINNLEIELAKLKAKKETIESGQEKYNLSISINKLEDQISKAKSKIDYGDRSFENSLSLVGATEEEFQSIMSANNIYVKQAGIGTGNAVKYIDPKTNEEVYIDLQPFTYSEKIKSAKQIDQLKNSFKSLSNEELSKNIA